MSVVYRPIDGESVSDQWYTALRQARADGVGFNVNEGHRTMARQWYFWNLYQSGRGNLAAYPSSTAPHIRTGRFDHAIDFNNAAGVIRWLRNHGINAWLSVRGESWHVDASASDLQRYHNAHKGPVVDAVGYAPVIRRGSYGPAVYRAQTYLRYKDFWHLSKQSKAYGKYTESAVRAFQRSRRLKADGVIGPATWRALRVR